jgi:hypothetical protein
MSDVLSRENNFLYYYYYYIIIINIVIIYGNGIWNGTFHFMSTYSDYFS